MILALAEALAVDPMQLPLLPNGIDLRALRLSRRCDFSLRNRGSILLPDTPWRGATDAPVRATSPAALRSRRASRCATRSRGVAAPGGFALSCHVLTAVRLTLREGRSRPGSTGGRNTSCLCAAGSSSTRGAFRQGRSSRGSKPSGLRPFRLEHMRSTATLEPYIRPAYSDGRQVTSNELNTR